MKAKGKLNGQDIEAEVVNPGGWFGKAWLVEVACGCWPFFYVVEADTLQDAIDEFADSEKHGHHIRIDVEVEGGDYGFAVSPGDIIGGKNITEKGWMNLKGELFTETPACVSEPYTSGGGVHCDLDNMMVHGKEGRQIELPWECVYVLEDGREVSPLNYDEDETPALESEDDK